MNAEIRNNVIVIDLEKPLKFFSFVLILLSSTILILQILNFIQFNYTKKFSKKQKNENKIIDTNKQIKIAEVKKIDTNKNTKNENIKKSSKSDKTQKEFFKVTKETNLAQRGI